MIDGFDSMTVANPHTIESKKEGRKNNNDRIHLMNLSTFSLSLSACSTGMIPYRQDIYTNFTYNDKANNTNGYETVCLLFFSCRYQPFRQMVNK